nr:hypothetical protein [Tanacetum cinerariifolium]
IIIEQPQRPADVHQDELYPPNKCYALMGANKKIDLDNPLYPNESKIMENIIQNHPLRFCVAAFSFVPWIYVGQIWHTLHEDGSKYRLKFVLDQKDITMTDFRIIFHLPQAIDNNHERFIVALKFSEMVPFFLNTLSVTLEKHKDSLGLKIPSWMITDEMKLMDHSRMYALVFGVDVPTTQSQPIESTQGTHRTLIEDHLIAEEIEKLVEGAENVEKVEKLIVSPLGKMTLKQFSALGEEEACREVYEYTIPHSNQIP